MNKQNEYFPQSVPHPGETLEEKLQEMNMGPKEFAIRTGKPEKTVTAILKGESAITPDMALLFENVTKIPMRFWMNAQRNYDEYRALERQQKQNEESTDWAARFPVKEMGKLGWIPSNLPKNEWAGALLAFFGIGKHKGWEDIYYNQALKGAFRISLAHTNEPYAISAWLRKGELLASELSAVTYSDKVFKECLNEIKTLMATHPDNFSQQLQQLCLLAGVKVVYMPCLPKAPIHGATRWLNDTPVIQLSGRYNRNDNFWFTFFHEAGHILLHGKKDIFLEKVEYSEKDMEKEKEADAFAVKWTFSESEEAEVLSKLPITEADIITFAQKFNTHPAMIIGRFQHKKRIPYFVGREFIKSVDLGIC